MNGTDNSGQHVLYRKRTTTLKSLAQTLGYNADILTYWQNCCKNRERRALQINRETESKVINCRILKRLITIRNEKSLINES